MTRRILLALVVLLFAAPSAHAITPEQVTAALQASPCHGQPIAVLWNAGLEAQGLGATASGAHYTDETMTTIAFDRCEITRNPVDWAKLNRAERCMEDLHEVLHLAGLLHEPTGVMAVKPEDRGWFAPCHTLRERVRHDIQAMLPADAQVACGKWRGRAFTCLADWASASGFSREARYRVRVRGQQYTIKREGTT